MYYINYIIIDDTAVKSTNQQSSGKFYSETGCNTSFNDNEDFHSEMVNTSESGYNSSNISSEKIYTETTYNSAFNDDEDTEISLSSSFFECLRETEPFLNLIEPEFEYVYDIVNYNCQIHLADIMLSDLALQLKSGSVNIKNIPGYSKHELPEYIIID